MFLLNNLKNHLRKYFEPRLPQLRCKITVFTRITPYIKGCNPFCKKPL